MSDVNIPRVTAVFCFNNTDCIGSTVEKLKSLSYKDLEIIAVCTGNDYVFKEVKREIKGIKIVKSPVFMSKNAGTNYGVKISKGEYILLMDDDVIIEDNKIFQNLIQEFKKYPKIGCLALASKNKGEKDVRIYGFFFGKVFSKDNESLPEDYVKSLNGIKVGHPSGMGIFTNKKVLNNVGVYDEDYIFGGDDSDLGIRMWIFGYECRLFSKSIQLHAGMSRRSDDKRYAVYFGRKLFAHLGVITKNYKILNCLRSLTLYSAFMFLKAIKQSIQRRSIYSLLGFFKGEFMYLKNFKKIIKGRQYIQQNRTIKEDVFLEIKKPEYEKN